MRYTITATFLGTLCIDQNLELVHVRMKINELMLRAEDKSSGTAHCGADNTSVTNKFVSLDWCFVDCKSACLHLSNMILICFTQYLYLIVHSLLACTAERFFRIDRAQEHLHFVVDICNDDLFILDPSDPSEEKDEIDLFDTASQSSLNSSDKDSIIMASNQQFSFDETAIVSCHSNGDSRNSSDNPISTPTDFSVTELLNAAKHGDLSLLKQLHHKGVSLLSVDQNG